MLKRKLLIKLPVSISLALLCVGCHLHQPKNYPGFIDADYIYISSELGGVVKNMAVEKGDEIKHNSLLVEIDDYLEQTNIKIAEDEIAKSLANLKDIESEFELKTKDSKRKETLFKKGLIPESNIDSIRDQNIETQQKYEIAQTNLLLSQKKLSLEKYNSEKKRLLSPVNGRIQDRYFLNGEYVRQGQPILAILTPKRIKAVFFVPEFELDKINYKQTVSLYINSKKVTTAKISYIATKPEFTPPNIYSSEYSKELSFRVEALPDDPEKIKPGQIIVAKFEE